MIHTYGEEDGVPCLVLLVEGPAGVEAICMCVCVCVCVCGYVMYVMYVMCVCMLCVVMYVCMWLCRYRIWHMAYGIWYR
jgi:hypothetical protein